MSDSARPTRHERGKSTRLDAPHTLSDSPPARAEIPSRQKLAAIAGHDPVVASEQLQRQAAEIRGQLASQARQLDHREAEFNARVAHMESELRTARLMCREREEALAENQREAAQRINELRQRNADLAAAGIAITADDRAHRQQSRAQSSEVQQVVATWHQRLRALDRDERSLQAQLADVAAERQKLEKERAQLAEQRHHQATQYAAAERDYQQRRAQQLSELHQHSQQIDRRRLALEQLHADIMRMYREALETRICNEELWAVLTESVSEAELAQRGGELRRKLADQFQLAAQAVAERQTEVRELLARLEDHQRTLRKQRDQLRHWVTRRHEEVELLASKLLTRERELDLREASLQQTEQSWIDRQRGYEQELRRLRQIHPAA